MELPTRIIMDGIDRMLRDRNTRASQEAADDSYREAASHRKTVDSLSDTITEGMQREGALRLEIERLTAAMKEADRTIESWVRHGFTLNATLREIAASWAPPGRAPDMERGCEEIAEMNTRAGARLNAVPAQRQPEILDSLVDATMPTSVAEPTKRHLARK